MLTAVANDERRSARYLQMGRDVMNALTHPLRILIVNDDARMCDALRRLVRPVLSHDSLLVACARAEDALTLARRVEFDVVLCDLHLPEMDGIGFCALLERTNP